VDQAADSAQDNAVHTVRGAIRVPTVIVAVNFAKVPKKRPKLSEAAHRSACAEGIAGNGAHSQRPRCCRVEAVPERVKQQESGRESSLSRMKSTKLITSK